MKIEIKYEASWRNSFLDGSNNEPLPKKGRKFIGSMTNLRKAENYKERHITIDTIMGILNRLIGDQRKLYQARNEQYGDYYFKEIESFIEFKDKPEYINHEIAYIRNISGSTDQNAFTGLIKTNDPIFSADYSDEFWGLLVLEFDELCDFIIDPSKQVTTRIDKDPLSIAAQFEVLKKLKPVENKDQAQQAMDTLHQSYPDERYLNAKEQIVPSMLYCSALYLQQQRLSKRFDTQSILTKSGVISGISKRGFTKKDFMNKFTTGEKKRIWGNPYIRKERIKGVGEVVSTLKKVSGMLEIQLNIDKKQAKILEKKIKEAGVSSFYLGKKGLAYVSKIKL